MGTSYGMKHLTGAMALGVLLYVALILTGQLFVAGTGGSYPADGALVRVGWNLLVGTALVCGAITLLAIVCRLVMLIARTLRPSDAQQPRSA